MAFKPLTALVAVESGMSVSRPEWIEGGNPGIAKRPEQATFPGETMLAKGLIAILARRRKIDQFYFPANNKKAIGLMLTRK